MAAPILLRPPNEPDDPETRRMLARLTDALTGPDEPIRLQALTAVRKQTHAGVRASVVAELLAVLHRGKAEACRHAADALVAIGPPAVPALVHGLCQDAHSAWQMRLTNVLGRIAPALEGDARALLLVDLNQVVLLTSHDAVARAVMRVFAPLAVADLRAARAAGLASPSGGT
jgi:hypothetical protein